MSRNEAGRQRSSRTDQVPELIVVGITNTSRSRDLTPPSGDAEETAFWDEVGGADEFRRLLAEELIPFVDEESRTAIPGTGGLHKIRWSGSGRGKRGGSRVIYYWATEQNGILMLMIFAKNERSDLTARQKAILRRIVEDEYR